MDLAQSELSRICSANNPYCAAGVDYYFVDQEGLTVQGETALHRLVALHAPPSTIESFLYHRDQHMLLLQGKDTVSNAAGADEHLYQHCRADPPSLFAQNAMGCTALHVVVHRNSWQVDQVTRLLLQACPQLASIPMSCGSYPLHILTGHSMTIHPTVLQDLIHADRSVCGRDDGRRDTPLSLLWKNVLRFRWAQEWEVHGVVPELDRVDGGGGPSWMTVISPDQFRDYALLMMMKRDTTTTTTTATPSLTWHTVCNTPRCPPLLIRLLLEHSQQQYVEGSLWDRDDCGCLPLHRAAHAPPVSLEFGVPESVLRGTTTTTSVVELLLQVTPTAACVTDSSGALPLHYALRQEQARESDIWALIRAWPEGLLMPDPLTNLYPVHQWASRLTDDKDDLSLLYCMIRTDPEMLHYHL